MPTNNYAEDADETKARIRNHYESLTDDQKNVLTDDQIITFMRDNAHAGLRIGLTSGAQNNLNQSPKEDAIKFYRDVVDKLVLEKKREKPVVKNSGGKRGRYSRKNTRTVVPGASIVQSSPVVSEKKDPVKIIKLSSDGLERKFSKRIKDLGKKIAGIASDRSQAKDCIIDILDKLQDPQNNGCKINVDDLQKVVQDLKKGRQKVFFKRYGEKSGKILQKIEKIVNTENTLLIKEHNPDKLIGLQNKVKKELESCPTIKKR